METVIGFENLLKKGEELYENIKIIDEETIVKGVLGIPDLSDLCSEYSIDSYHVIVKETTGDIIQLVISPEETAGELEIYAIIKFNKIVGACISICGENTASMASFYFECSTENNDNGTANFKCETPKEDYECSYTY